MSRWWGAVLATAMLALASPAAAEPGLLVGTECRMLPVASPTSCPDGSFCSADGTGGTCRTINMTNFCVPDGAVTCCDAEHDCPGVFGGLLVGCVRVSGFGLCSAPGTDYCTGGTIPTTSQFLACHRRFDGTIGPFGEGDCDGDGIANGIEEVLGTDHCLAPARMAVFDPTTGTCIELPVGCTPGLDCGTPFGGDAGLCLAGAGATTCFPPGTRLFCGDGEWVCPDGTLELPDDDARHTFCVPDVCEDPAETSIDCVHHPVTREPVPAPEGDCDRDGAPNELDPDPCDDSVADAGTSGPDAGDPPPGDGGNVPRDAGDPNRDAGLPPAMDAGTVSSDDAGANIPPAFGGGGGCACGAAPRAGGTAVGLVGFALALSLRGARRARRTRPGGAGRRCPR